MYCRNRRQELYIRHNSQSLPTIICTRNLTPEHTKTMSLPTNNLPIICTVEIEDKSYTSVIIANHCLQKHVQRISFPLLYYIDKPISTVAHLVVLTPEHTKAMSLPTNNISIICTVEIEDKSYTSVIIANHHLQ